MKNINLDNKRVMVQTELKEEIARLAKEARPQTSMSAMAAYLIRLGYEDYTRRLAGRKDDHRTD